MTKGDWLSEFEMCVLLALDHLKDEGYGMNVRQHIEECGGRRVAIGAVYATLSRLEDKELVAFTLTEAQSVPGGRRRKCYRLTPSGARALRASTSMLRRLMAARPASPGGS